MEAAPLTGRVPSFALLAAAIAGQVAFVIAPIGVHFDSVGPWVYWTAPFAPLLFAYGWIQRSASALLVGVPAGWFVVAYGLPGLGYGGSAAIILVTLAYAVAAALWSQPDSVPSDASRWQVEAAEDTDRPFPVLPTLVCISVTISGLTVAVWPALQARAMGAFPGLGERVIVGLGLVGTLAGLFVAVSLLRLGPPLSWRPARAILLSVMFLSAAAFWWIV